MQAAVDGGEASKHIPMPHTGPRGAPLTDSRAIHAGNRRAATAAVQPAGTSTAGRSQ